MPQNFHLGRLLTAALLASCIFQSTKVLQVAAEQDLGLQEGPAILPCVDEDPKCAAWAKADQCVSNPFYMLGVCASSCRVAFGCKPTGVKLSPWKGHATDHGTRMFATMYTGAQVSARAGLFRRDPSMGTFYFPSQTVRGDPWLTLSSLGTGTYLGNDNKATDQSAAAGIVMAVHNGWNVIDTASNYRNGRAEVSVGQAIQVLRGIQALTGIPGMTGREMVFITTKAGFLSKEQWLPLVQQGKIKEDDVIRGQHCIHPECLKASLEHSLKAMNLETVDVLYLHNAVETQMGVLGETAFLERLHVAFTWMEESRKQGKIRAYGLATWDCFRKPPLVLSAAASGYLQLQRVVNLAREIGGSEHGFRYVQLPVNMRMPEAWKEDWQPVPQIPASNNNVKMGTLLEAAAHMGVGVFASGPLQEGELVKDEKLQAFLQSADELSDVKDAPARLLQLARSTPMVLSSLVGHKTPEHVTANLQVGKVEPLSWDAFHSVQAGFADSAGVT